MAVFKCKMCGGALEISEDITVAECEYCGSKQTVPTADNEKKISLFTRANKLRAACEFDKAAGVYESIVAEFIEEAEAYWGLILCNYGIEYVDDPKTGKKIPTCHRTSFDSVLDSENFELVMENADAVAKKVYREEAKAIEELRKSIIEVSSKEEPYDIFICYKETDEKGDRTIDSVIAQDVYTELTDKGYRVFFSRITLEDKLGQEYEPYIFAALNSAKVMLAFGTDYEYYNAVWVKNEWSRFLQLIEKGEKKTIIPCYKNIDAYDMPKEFARLQAQDMGKVGATQDLLRGVEKIIGKKESAAPAMERVVVNSGDRATVDSLLKRAFMFLEDGDWNSAKEYCEKVLDIDPECAEAYLGKLMAYCRAKKQESLKDQAKPFDHIKDYQKAIRFADEKLKTVLVGYIEHINTRNENARIDSIYTRAKNAMSAANTESDYKEAVQLFESIREYKDSATLANECFEKAEVARKDAILDSGKLKMKSGTIADYEEAIKFLSSVSGWKDANEKIYACQKKIEEVKAKEEAERIETERKAKEAMEEEEERKKKKKKMTVIITSLACIAAAVVILICTVIIPNSKYNNAIALVQEGSNLQGVEQKRKYYEAAKAFNEIEKFKDAKQKSEELWENITFNEYVSGGMEHTVGLKADGTVVAVGKNLYGQCDVSEWSGIVALSAGYEHTVGLKADGTVVAVGHNDDGQCDVSEWKDIVAISAGYDNTVGLKADGTVVAVGMNEYGQCDVSGWTDIVAISAGTRVTAGLKSDGTVVTVGTNYHNQYDASSWTDIVAISVGSGFTVGLKSDGTVVAVGYNDDGECNISGWTDIVAISAGDADTVGLKSDGTVVSTGKYSYNFSGWTDIDAISIGYVHTIGSKSDGTVAAVGYNNYGQCNISSWTNIKLSSRK